MKTDENGENGKEYTEGEALEEAFSKIGPHLDPDQYLKMRVYKSRYRSGSLGRAAIQTVLTFFGFRPTSYKYYRKKDKSGGDDMSDLSA